MKSDFFRVGDRVVDDNGMAGEVIGISYCEGDQYLSVRFDKPIWPDGGREGGVHAEALTFERFLTMHYRNGREAKNGDKIVKFDGGKVVSFGVLHSATPGNDYCNGYIAVIQPPNDYACLCDCLHIDDVVALLAEKGLDKRPAGK